MFWGEEWNEGAAFSFKRVRHVAGVGDSEVAELGMVFWVHLRLHFCESPA